jgi:hypothetical protein
VSQKPALSKEYISKYWKLKKLDASGQRFSIFSDSRHDKIAVFSSSEIRYPILVLMYKLDSKSI